MGTIIINERTTKDPITCIGELSGVCYGSDTTDPVKNYKRGKHNLKSGHGRTWEYPDVYLVIDGYSARVIREFYTHVAGAPTRTQASTRYIDYATGGFQYITPPSINKKPGAKLIWDEMMKYVNDTLLTLEEIGIPHEDTANGLPLGMETKMVCKINMRTLISMSNVRTCTCAYWEYRQLMKDIIDALNDYSDEWKEITKEFFVPKCDVTGYCNEYGRGCGRHPYKKEDL